jgi:phosphoenolpyruvate carboxykinase (GTP)
MGKQALDELGPEGFFVPCIHSVGAPLKRGQADSPWPCNKEQKWIVHFPEQRRIWSYGSGYGGNALLGKKCFSLRIASAMGREEGWLAEHMLIVGITNPQGIKKYFAAAFPSACGKTNLALMEPKLPGWKVECVGDDIAWMQVGPDGQLYAINPEAGFFGVAPGTSTKTNANAMHTIESNTIFTNCALTPENDVWWEGITSKPPPRLLSWLRTDWAPGQGLEAAHPNARFTVPASQCPSIDPAWDDPKGVPISGIIFGGRRSSTIPLVFEARDWEHGVFVGATMNSETTAAAAGKRGVLRSDPFAMMPFCGYNMADYFGHWLSFTQRTQPAKLPKMFHVNWFRKSPQGKFMWPGFGDNIRVLEWIFNRCEAENNDDVEDTVLGLIPKPGTINVEGLNLSNETMDNLFAIDKRELNREVERHKESLQIFRDRLPPEIKAQLQHMGDRVSKLK